MNDAGTGFAGIAVAVTMALSLGSLWAAAWLLGGLTVQVPVAEAVVDLVVRGSAPAEAWGTEMNTQMYWVVVAGIVIAVLAVVALLFRAVFAQEWGTKSRERLGSSTEAEFATTKDLETLWGKLRPTGRFLLGRTDGWAGTRLGSKMLFTEWRHNPNKRRLSARARKRENDRGAVMIFGPSRSGKTRTTLSAIHYWDGPVIMSSVKDDLLPPTLAHRRRCGEVAVFDPVGYLKEAYAGDNAGRPDAWDDELRVSWSPLRNAHTFRGARRASRELTGAGPDAGGDNEMWVRLAESLLTGLLFVAANSGNTMRSVVRWVSHQDSPGATGDEGEVLPLLAALLNTSDLRLAADARSAYDSLSSVWSQSPKIVSSVYTTASSVVDEWLDASVAESATGQSVDLDWLCSGNNTLYLVADPKDAKKSGPVFGGMISDLIGQAFERQTRTGKPIDPPLLVVLDEAGNLSLDELPEWASTVAGLGVQLVTIWQSLAQVQSTYRDRTDIVVANHLTKIAFGGSSDDSTLKYMSTLVGEEEVETQVNNSDKWRWGQGSIQLQGTRLSLAPTHTIRQMPAQRCLMVHGTLKPAYTHGVPWDQSRKLQKRTVWEAGDRRGLPVSLTKVVQEGEDEWPEWDQLDEAAASEPGLEDRDALRALGLR